MPIQVRFGGAWRAITGAQVYAGGAWRQLVAAQVYSGGAWRQVANFTPPGGGGGGGGSLAVTTSSNAISGLGAPSSTTVTTNSVTATPSGGLAPYTYAWSFVSTDGQSYTINSNAVATTTVTGSGLPLDTANTCTIHCVVTDSLGTTATTSNVVATLTTRSTS
jgi:hypothetical protein